MPELLRAALRIGVLIAGLSIATLPFQPRGSAEFVVTVLAAFVGLAFIAGVALLGRTARVPRRAGDGRKDYNRRFSRRGP